MKRSDPRGGASSDPRAMIFNDFGIGPLGETTNHISHFRPYGLNERGPSKDHSR